MQVQGDSHEKGVHIGASISLPIFVYAYIYCGKKYTEGVSQYPHSILTFYSNHVFSPHSKDRFEVKCENFILPMNERYFLLHNSHNSMKT